MDKIKWGIIGAGAVTNVKSGPAFQKIENSELVAVMRRDARKAEDYARRHQVGRWYSAEADLIEITGENGKLSLPCFQHGDLLLENQKGIHKFSFVNPENIQHNLIQQVVKYVNRGSH